MEILLNKEEEKDVTLPSDEKLEPETPVELNNSPVPTEEDKSEAGDSPETGMGPNLDEAPAPEMTEEQKAVERLFTQTQLNEIVGQRVNETREKTHNDTIAEMLDTFGVDNMDALKTLVGDGQRFPALQEDMANEKKTSEQRILDLEKSLKDVSSELALFKSGIDPDRYEDAKLILAGKGLEITAENIKNEMATHPEWEKKPVTEPTPAATPAPEMPGAPVEGQGEVPVFEKESEQETEKEPISKITRLGNPKGGSVSTEREDAMKLFDF